MPGPNARTVKRHRSGDTFRYQQVFVGKGGCSAHSPHTHSGIAGWNTRSSTEVRWTEREGMEMSAMLAYRVLSAGPGRSLPAHKWVRPFPWWKELRDSFARVFCFPWFSHWRAEKLGHGGEKDFPRFPGRHLPTSHCHQVHFGCFNGGSR